MNFSQAFDTVSNECKTCSALTQAVCESESKQCFYNKSTKACVNAAKLSVCLKSQQMLNENTNECQKCTDLNTANTCP